MRVIAHLKLLGIYLLTIILIPCLTLNFMGNLNLQLYNIEILSIFASEILIKTLNYYQKKIKQNILNCYNKNKLE